MVQYRVFGFLFVGLVVLFSNTAAAVELNYQWKKGSIYRFDASSNDVVSMQGMMKVEQTFNTHSEFALKIDGVSKGVASGTLAIERFSVETADGRKMAGLDDIPKGALKSLVEIDRKGRFKFKEIVYLVINDEGDNLLVSSKMGPNSASSSARVDGEEVTVYAQFDPKTGALSGGYTTKKVAKKKKKVAVKQDATKVDVLPTQFLEMLRLPDGSVDSGADVRMDMPGMASVEVNITIVELSPARAKLRTKVETKMETGAVATAAQDDADDDMGEGEGNDDEDAMPAMPGMGGMPGMGMPGMGGGLGAPAPSGAPGGAGGAGGAPQMQMNGDFHTDFNVAKGMLDSLEGTLSTTIDVAGMMKITNRSKLKMTVK